nr:hypothetical protein [uncultured Sphaerochaeta sp.]
MIAPEGQTRWHLPQLVQKSGLITIRFFAALLGSERNGSIGTEPMMPECFFK